MSEPRKPGENETRELTALLSAGASPAPGPQAWIASWGGLAAVPVQEDATSPGTAAVPVCSWAVQ